MSLARLATELRKPTVFELSLAAKKYRESHRKIRSLGEVGGIKKPDELKRPVVVARRHTGVAT